MNLERVQKYYELIDRELGIESNDFDSFDYDDELDLFGFESDEDDLFGFESDYDDELDLFGFESDEDDLFGFESNDFDSFDYDDESDLFGFESDEDNLFGTEGIKEWFGKAKDGTRNVIKKSFAFVMNILRTIISAITTWWKKGNIKKMVKLLKKHFANKDAKKEDVKKLVDAIEPKDTSEKKDIANFLKAINGLTDKSVLESIEKRVEAVKKTKIADMGPIVKAYEQMTDITSIITDSHSAYSSTAFSLVDKTAEEFDNLGRSLTLLMNLVTYVTRKSTQFFQRKGETWFMQQADKDIIKKIKDLQGNVRALIKGSNALLKGLTVIDEKAEGKAEETKSEEKTETKEGKTESIMSDIQDMMVANESLNDIIFDMEMEI